MTINLTNTKVTYFFIGFISISLSWILSGIFTFLFFQRDSWNPEIVIYLFILAGIVSFIGYLPFQLILLIRLKPSNFILRPFIFPILTILYAIFVAIITGLITDELYDCMSQIVLVVLIGLFFGIFYSILLRLSNKTSFFNNWTFRILTPIIPLILLSLLFIVIPKVKPLWVYEFLPRETMDEIHLNALKKLNVGDKFSILKKDFPYEFEKGEYKYYDTISYRLESDDYDIEVSNDTVKMLKFHNDN